MLTRLQAQNALSSVTLRGLLSELTRDRVPIDSSLSIPTELRRLVLPSDLIKPRMYPVPLTKASRYFRPDGAPQRRESQLPPPTQQHLEATLGKCLGSGLTSVVYALENICIAHLEPNVVIPPLVVKISRRHRVPWLAQEAWFYEEIECLQGSVAPYCYGLFEAELGDCLDSMHEPHYCIKTLDDHSVDDGRSSDTSSNYEAPPLTLRWQAAHPILAEQETRHDIVSVLILERVGGMLRICRPVPQEARYFTAIYHYTFKLKHHSSRDDFRLMHEDLAELGISKFFHIALQITFKPDYILSGWRHS